MACCGKGRSSSPQPADGSVPAAGTVLNRRTRKYVSLHQALVDRPPDSGWRFRSALRGVPLEIIGRSPVDAMAQTREAFHRNNEAFDELSFWIEANLQWVQDTNIKHHLVSIGDLLAVRDNAYPLPGPRAGARHHPGEWGSVAWRFLGLLLAKDNYNPHELIATMRIVVDMLNPSSNPRLGCAECHTEASGMLNDLLHNPPVDLSAARIWLLQKHNAVNARLSKPQLQMSEAASANFWS